MPSCVEKPLSGDRAAHCSSYSSESNLNTFLEDNESNDICSSLTISSDEKQNGHSSENSLATVTPSVIKKQSSSSLILKPNFYLLPGEDLDTTENVVDMGNSRIFLTQYRIVIYYKNRNEACVVPLTDVESLEAKDITGLNITCKDGLIIKLRADSSETAIVWYKKLIQKTCVSRDLSSIFAFQFSFAICKDRSKSPKWLRPEILKASTQANQSDLSLENLNDEFKKLCLSEDHWRISSVNKQFELCSTYPQYLIVPTSVTDEELKVMRYGRFHYRIPTLVWRYRKNGAVLLRSSQPNLAFFGMMTNENDVKLYDKIKSAATSIASEQASKFLIVDARSYTAAWANRAKSGGFETSDTYSNAEICFMGLPNIHSIRYSFHQLRNLLNSNIDSNTYLQTLQSTLWLQNIGQLFSAVEKCLNALCKEGVSVLVHCSDGWDRTTQIISLCMLIADPMYRSFEGFQTLVQRQWIEFGHKFADRNSVLNGDENEKSPVFLQWIDCVYQLWEKNPDSFQFNRRYLMKLVQHIYSGLFGSFLFNSIKEASDSGCFSSSESLTLESNVNNITNSCVYPRVFSIWDYLGRHNYDEFLNPAYDCRNHKRQLVYPKYLPELILWREAYCNSNVLSFINNSDDCIVNGADLPSEKSSSTLSRSQSASSLTSLDQNTPHHSFHGYSPGAHMNHSGLPSSQISCPKSSDGNSYGSHMSIGLKSLDTDGLSKVPVMFEDRILERIQRDFHHFELQKNKVSPITPSSGSHRDLNGGYCVRHLDGMKNGRTRNESIDSTGFEIVVGASECSRQKHNSSSTASTVSIFPSSYSSTCTTLSEYCPYSSHTSTSTTVNGT